MKDDPQSLPFDQYQRYRLVADILLDVRDSAEPLRILDVGGRTGLLRRFLPEDEVVLVDLEPSAERGLVLGDGSRLPFRGAAFDAVVAFDTLEHVPPERRRAFLDECRRMARRWVVLAGPYQSEPVERAEVLLDRFVSEKLEQTHRYLEEHRRLGLPERAAVEERLREHGARVASIGHANVERWLAQMCLSLYMDRDAPLRAIAADFHRLYNERLYAADRSEPFYRHAVVAAFEGAPLPREEGLFPAVRAAPPETPALTHLLQELLAFDAGRDAVAAEWQRLEDGNLALERDVEGHRRTLAEVRWTADEQARVLAQRTTELEETRAAYSAVEQELRGAHLQAAEAVTALERDLEGHRGALAEAEAGRAHEAQERLQLLEELQRERRVMGAVRAELQRDLEDARASASELESVVERLEREMERHAREAAKVERELEESTRELERLTADLASEREHIAELRAALRDRLGNLKRAFSPRKPEW